MVQKLTVLYDSQCGFCVRCRWWLVRQPKFVEMDFYPAGTPETRERFPELDAAGKPDELVVVDDRGGVYRNTSAWLMCLWALEEYREWAERLASPALRPFARALFGAVSASRRTLSRWLRLDPDAEDEELIDRLRQAAEPPRCAD